jgi:hypothetical protein
LADPRADCRHAASGLRRAFSRRRRFEPPNEFAEEATATPPRNDSLPHGRETQTLPKTSDTVAANTNVTNVANMVIQTSQRVA